MTSLEKQGKSATAQMGSSMRREAAELPGDYVHESRFGFWFLGTLTWEKRVVEVALEDLRGLIDQPQPPCHVVLDAGCGQGKAFQGLVEHFQAEKVIGVDADAAGLDLARREAERHGIPVELKQCDCAAIDLPDASVDLVFCHQTLHHLARQEETLAEFHRVLKPGGLLLIAESMLTEDR